jgi:ATP-dependent RNA helicase DeaD
MPARGKMGRKDFLMPSFDDFSLQSATLSALAQMNISEPTPIQSEAIPALMAGRDLLGQSATGSGKTLAYSLPLVERLSRERRGVQALVLVPTRELAMQVNTVLSRLGAQRRLITALLVGGKPYGKQIAALRYGAQIVVGTPGRVKDHLEQGSLNLHQVRICVLDEADQMLDIGFAPVIEDILTHTPETRQMALFSATMPDWIAKLEEKFLKDPLKVVITPASGSQSTIEQVAYQVPQSLKMAALCTLLQNADGESTLIFGRTKYGVEKLGQQLSKLGFTVGTLHGNKSQHAREEVLSAFRRGQVQTLLATNVAARGLDIAGIYQVINYELPESSELFTHRIGRTGRMGRQGLAITLLVPADVSKWRRMARSLGQPTSVQKLAIDESAALSLQSAPVVAETLPATLEQTSTRARIITLPIAESEQRVERPARRRQRSAGERSEAPYREQWPTIRLARARQAPAPVSERDEESRPFTRDQERSRAQRPARARKASAPAFEYDERPRAARARAFATNEDEADFAPTRRSKSAPARFAQAGRQESRPAWSAEKAGSASGGAREERRRSSRPVSFSKKASRERTRPLITSEAQAHEEREMPVLRLRKNASARRSARR